MKTLISRGNGQLGKAVASLLKTDETIVVDLPGTDVSDVKQVGQLIRDHKPDIIINCAAYTNVDGCVKDYATAYRANAIGPMNLALACRQAGIPLVQVSTNEVFDGTCEEGYEEWMSINPINRYGMRLRESSMYDQFCRNTTLCELRGFLRRGDGISFMRS